MSSFTTLTISFETSKSPTHFSCKIFCLRSPCDTAWSKLWQAQLRKEGTTFPFWHIFSGTVEFPPANKQKSKQQSKSSSLSRARSTDLFHYIRLLQNVFQGTTKATVALLKFISEEALQSSFDSHRLSQMSKGDSPSTSCSSRHKPSCSSLLHTIISVGYLYQILNKTNI